MTERAGSRATAPSRVATLLPPASSQSRSCRLVGGRGAHLRPDVPHFETISSRRVPGAIFDDQVVLALPGACSSQVTRFRHGCQLRSARGASSPHWHERDFGDRALYGLRTRSRPGWQATDDARPESLGARVAWRGADPRSGLTLAAQQPSTQVKRSPMATLSTSRRCATGPRIGPAQSPKEACESQAARAPRGRPSREEAGDTPGTNAASRLHHAGMRRLTRTDQLALPQESLRPNAIEAALAKGNRQQGRKAGDETTMRCSRPDGARAKGRDLRRAPEGSGHVLSLFVAVCA